MTKAFQILVIGSFTFLVSSVCAQEAKLIEAAKKEGGKIVAYGSLESDTTEAVKKAFEKKTGLSMEVNFALKNRSSMSFWFMMRRCGSC
jgi:ABC-type molybdate transport system substrate-binding protein